MTTILVIDDDQALVELFSESLEIEGFKVFKGYDGQTALELAKAHQPDLIVMDVNMPFINGLEAVKALRADPKMSDIPVIFLTGEPSAIFYPFIESSTRVTYLKKPVDLDELLSMVRHIIVTYPRMTADSPSW